MDYSLEEILETIHMTFEHHFDIRTVTLGVNLKDCIDSSPERCSEKVRSKLLRVVPPVVKIQNDAVHPNAVLASGRGSVSRDRIRPRPAGSPSRPFRIRGCTESWPWPDRA